MDRHQWIWENDPTLVPETEGSKARERAMAFDAMKAQGVKPEQLTHDKEMAKEYAAFLSSPTDQ